MSNQAANVNEERKASTKSYLSSGAQSTLKFETRFEKAVHQNLFNSLAILGIVLGISLGCTLRYSFVYDKEKEFWNPRTLGYISFPGEIIIRMLQGLKIPLALSCIVAAVGSMDMRTFGFAFWRMLTCIVLSTVFAASFGVIVAQILQIGQVEDHPKHPICYWVYPGDFVALAFGNASCSKDLHPCYIVDYSRNVWEFKPGDEDTRLDPNPDDCGDHFRTDKCEIPLDDVLDSGDSFFPENIINAFLLTTERNLDFKAPNYPTPNGTKDANELPITDCETFSYAQDPKPSLDDFGIYFTNIPGTNVIGLIVVTTFLALAAVSLGDAGRPILNIFTSLSQCTLKIAVWVTWLCPIGICSLIAVKILREKDLTTLHRSVVKYVLATLLALLLYGFAVLPGVYYFFVRKSPIRFYKRIMPLMGMSFGLSNSWATLPLMIQILEDSCKLDPRIVRFMLPIASEISLDGGAIHAMVSVIYTAQLHGIELDLCTIGTAIVMTFITLTLKGGTGSRIIERRFEIIFRAIQMPSRFYVYFIAVEWVLDYFKTLINVVTRCVEIAIVDTLCAQQLEIMRLEEESRNAAEARKFDWGEPPDITEGERELSLENSFRIRQQRKLKHPKIKKKLRHALNSHNSSSKSSKTSFVSDSYSNPFIQRKSKEDKLQSIQSEFRSRTTKIRNQLKDSAQSTENGGESKPLKRSKAKLNRTNPKKNAIRAMSWRFNKSKKSKRSTKSRSKGNSGDV